MSIRIRGNFILRKRNASFSIACISKMCRYSTLFEYTIIVLLAAFAGGTLMDDHQQVAPPVDRQINALEDLISQNNEKLLKLEDRIEADKSELIEIQADSCEVRIAKKDVELDACQAQAKSDAARLKDNERQISDLVYNLTYCQITSVDWLDQSKTGKIKAAGEVEQTTEVNLGLTDKDREILDLQRRYEEQLKELQAARSKLKAYENQFDEFHPSSCLPFGSTTGIYKIKLPGMESFYAPCDSRFAGSGWLVIQRRMDGSVNFFRNWTDYQRGFGALTGEFFLGLEKLHRLTSESTYELYVHLEDFEGDVRYAHYDNFSIGSEQTSYELSSLGNYAGNAGNSMGLNVLQKFSTFDNDNDAWPDGNCARRYHSAWWYDACAAFCNPNGKYFKKRKLDWNTRGKGIIWHHWHGFEETLKFVQFMIRPISRSHY
ncbi:angiopoietin-related protein 7-like [Drosophila innubila]|uniref:angiopoietin-related protein 7-like n=1 Tax=Drosophila innubila TaxID=198719 RepID=UPI00148CD83F|nr:angiopoietin-related protein 7-like [Drosophila innubila]